MTASIKVEPIGVEFLADDGETVMAAAHRHGYQWPTICEGNGLCTVCWVEVVDGGSSLGPVGEAEEKALERLERVSDRPRLREVARLACQATVHGAVLLHKDGVQVAAD